MKLSQNELFLIKDVFRQIERQMKLSKLSGNYVFHDMLIFDEEEKEDIESILQKIEWALRVG